MRTNNDWTRLALTGAAVAALAGTMIAGCGTAPPRVKNDSVSVENYPKVQATGGLNKFMRINNANETRENDILYANVDIRWTGKKPVFYQYRFIFFDARGRPVNPDSAWGRGESAPGTVDYLSSNATTPNAIDWRLEIRPNQ